MHRDSRRGDGKRAARTNEDGILNVDKWSADVINACVRGAIALNLRL